MFFCEPTTNCEHKTQKILRTGGKLPSMFCECIWGGGAAPSPPTPLQLFFFKAYLLLQGQPTPNRNVSIEKNNIILKIKKKKSQNISAPIFKPLEFRRFLLETHHF